MKRTDDPAISGIFAIDKPAGLTSHDVVARVRRAVGMRRVGHAGTLDPMATGVLVVGVGSATRLLGIVGGHDKTYRATIRLGAATTTDDREGDVVAMSDPAAIVAIDDDAIAHATQRFLGVIAQRPSAVSAIKIDGKRAYERVRGGEDVQLPERSVTVTRYDIEEIRRSDEWIDVDVVVDCSAGTYIRALARDLGAGLGVGGHLTELRRMRSGGVAVDECIDVDDVGTETMLVPGAFVRRELPIVDVDEATALRARNGAVAALDDLAGAFDAPATALLGPGDDLVAVVAPGPRYLAVFPPASERT